MNRKYKSDYFKPVKDQVQRTLEAGIDKASERIIQKYEEELYNSVVNTIDTNVV